MNGQTDKDKLALEQFLLDIHCLDALRPWTDKFNLFDVLKITNAEIRHSNMLAWLLTPYENHGFEEAILAGLIRRLAALDTDGKYDVGKLLLMDLDDFIVEREWHNTDILISSEKEKAVIAIENKIWSGEHDDQLERYRKTVDNYFDDYPTRIYLYLTPDGAKASDEDHWLSISYDDIADIISAELDRSDIHGDAEVLIRNYLEMLRRDIVNDRELDEICNKIYRKHRRALDLIFEHRMDRQTMIIKLISQTLQQMDEEGLLRHDNEAWRTSFHTNTMNQFMPQLGENQGSWGAGFAYHYWFSVSNDGFYGMLELGGLDLPDMTKQYQRQIIDILKPNDKSKDNYQYKRVFKTKKFVLNENQEPEDVVPNQVRSAVKALLDKETWVCNQLVPH